MSRNFGLFSTVPYIGSPFGKPISLCSKQGEAPKAVPLLLQWLVYGAGTAKPQVGARVSLTGQGSVNPAIEAIRGVYIDNTNNSVPVYVNFTDTNYTVVCAPDTCIFSPVITSDLSCTIYAAGFTDGTVGETRVYLCNSNIHPFTNAEVQYVFPLEKASPLIQKGSTIYNSNFAPRALGDQIISYELTANSAVPITNCFNTPVGGFLYITSMFVTSTALIAPSGYLFPVITLGSALAQVFAISAAYQIPPQAQKVAEGSTGNAIFTTGPTIIQTNTLLDIQNANIKLDASQIFNLYVQNPIPSSSGLFHVTMCYTISPS